MAHLSRHFLGVLSTPTATLNPVCPKCGTKTNGKRSCCLRGGTWFNKCGNPGDAKFEHTWFEGIQACKRISSVSLPKAQAQAMTLTQTTTSQHPKSDEHPNSDQQKIITDSSNTKSKASEGFIHFTVSTGILLSVLHLCV